MSLTVTDSKTFGDSAENVYAAALTAVTNLEGNIETQDAETGEITVRFHKTIHGKVLGDRTFFDLNVQPDGDGSTLNVTAYPLDAVGRKLQFGARKGVTRTVLNWIHAHIDHNLKKQTA